MTPGGDLLFETTCFYPENVGCLRTKNLLPPPDPTFDSGVRLKPRTADERARRIDPTKKASPIHRPDHYARWAIEPVEFIMVNGLPFAVGNIIKYVMRYDAKDGVQDLKKAARYLEMLIKQVEDDPDFAK